MAQAILRASPTPRTPARTPLDPRMVWATYDRECLVDSVGAKVRTAARFPAWSDEHVYRILRKPRPEQPRRYVMPDRALAQYAPPPLATFERAAPAVWQLERVITQQQQRDYGTLVLVLCCWLAAVIVAPLGLGAGLTLWTAGALIGWLWKGWGDER